MQLVRGGICRSAGGLILFLHLSDGLQDSSIKGYLSAVRRMQIVYGLGDPFVASWPVLECTLKGIQLRQAKNSATRPQHRLPVTPAILRLLRQFWEACCMCFFGFLCSGEATVPSLREHNPEGNLSEGDVTLDRLSAPTLVQICIKASKTDPFRKGVVQHCFSTSLFHIIDSVAFCISIPFQFCKFQVQSCHVMLLCQMCVTRHKPSYQVPSERGFLYFGPSSRMHRISSVLCWFSL